MAQPAPAADAGCASNERLRTRLAAKLSAGMAEALMVIHALYCAAALIILAAIAVALGPSPRGRGTIYGVSMLITLILCAICTLNLIEHPNSSTVVLPIGLPWLGAHFRIDATAAFFLVVVNLGAAAASLFALGYGRHEQFPQRV